MLAALRHRNLVQVYALGRRDDVYFVMELVEGEPLADVIDAAHRAHERACRSTRWPGSSRRSATRSRHPRARHRPPRRQAGQRAARPRATTARSWSTSASRRRDGGDRRRRHARVRRARVLPRHVRVPGDRRLRPGRDRLRDADRPAAVRRGPSDELIARQLQEPPPAPSASCARAAPGGRRGPGQGARPPTPERALRAPALGVRGRAGPRARRARGRRPRAARARRRSSTTEPSSSPRICARRCRVGRSRRAWPQAAPSRAVPGAFFRVAGRLLERELGAARQAGRRSIGEAALARWPPLAPPSDLTRARAPGTSLDAPGRRPGAPRRAGRARDDQRDVLARYFGADPAHARAGRAARARPRRTGRATTAGAARRSTRRRAARASTCAGRARGWSATLVAGSLGRIAELAGATDVD